MEKGEGDVSPSEKKLSVDQKEVTITVTGDVDLDIDKLLAVKEIRSQLELNISPEMHARMEGYQRGNPAILLRWQEGSGKKGQLVDVPFRCNEDGSYDRTTPNSDVFIVGKETINVNDCMTFEHVKQ